MIALEIPSNKIKAILELILVAANITQQLTMKTYIKIMIKWIYLILRSLYINHSKACVNINLIFIINFI